MGCDGDSAFVTLRDYILKLGEPVGLETMLQDVQKLEKNFHGRRITVGPTKLLKAAGKLNGVIFIDSFPSELPTLTWIPPSLGFSIPLSVFTTLLLIWSKVFKARSTQRIE